MRALVRSFMASRWPFDHHLRRWQRNRWCRSTRLSNWST